MSQQQRKRSNSPKTPQRSLTSQRIIGQGEMAELIRAYDWEGTSLGPVESWSDTLVTAVNLLLGSQHAMFLWWGPELIQFYNDGYRPSIREDKHPAAVGQRGRDCWPEIWPIIGPQIEGVMSRGESTWNVNQLVPIYRNGKLSEVFWTYGYSPVRDKNGEVVGTLVVCTETTEQVLSDRRQRTLLSITADSTLPQTEGGESRLLSLTQHLINRLGNEPGDVPFAGLYFLDQGKPVLGGEIGGNGQLFASPGDWPWLQQAISSQEALLVEDLPKRFGEVRRDPWPEPITRAFVLPLTFEGFRKQAALILGISPRIPFDKTYETFFRIIAARVAGLLQSALHQMEREATADRFRRLAEANPFGLILGNLQGKVSYINSVLLQTLGYSEAEVRAGKVCWDDITPPEYAALDMQAVLELKSEGHCAVYEKEYVAKDGRRIPILVGASVLDPMDDASGVAAFVTDLTPLRAAQEALLKANDELERKVEERTAALQAEVIERNRAEASLRALTAQLLRLQDQERRRMARELHDHAGQTLVALGLNLAALEKGTANPSPPMSALLMESKGLADSLSREIRTMSYLLHPPLLDEVGLASALRWYLEGFSERSQIKVTLDLQPDLGRLPGELEITLFRVVQESLTNIHRHSESPSAKISVSRSRGEVKAEISDRGKGIPVEKQGTQRNAPTGVGVGGMRERVRQLNGMLQIVSNAKGTTVTVVLPIPE